MNEWESNNKQRREKRVRSIQQGLLHKPATPASSWNQEWSGFRERNHEVAGWNPSTYTKSAPKMKRKRRFFYQMTFSLLLLFITSFFFHTKLPTTQPVEQFVTEVMTREFNFAGLSQWYQQHVGATPVILPAFFANHANKSGVNPNAWIMPAKGKIVLPFDSKRKGVVLRTQAQAEVVAATEGWVIFAGQKEGLGNTVIIQHANGMETWYGWLQNLHIQEKDWVKSGQPLGQVAQTKKEFLIYFALKRGDHFVDPASVILFE
jgi:stage IV sporulation protein FA